MFHLVFVKFWAPLGEEFFKKEMKTFGYYLVQWDKTIAIIIHDACNTGGMRVPLFPVESIYSLCRNHLAKYRSSLQKDGESNLEFDSKLY